MEELYIIAEKVVYGFMKFGEAFIEMLNSPFRLLPTYIGIQPDNLLYQIWSALLALIGFNTNENLLNMSVLEVLIGPLLTTIIALGVIKYFKDLL